MNTVEVGTNGARPIAEVAQNENIDDVSKHLEALNLADSEPVAGSKPEHLSGSGSKGAKKSCMYCS